MTHPLIFDLTDSMLIPRAYLFRIRSSLNQGGLCVVPSDTCYVLAGIPVLRNVCRDINSILLRGRQPISVTFGTQNLAERFVEFNRANLQLIDDFTPGPVTIVAPLRADLPDVLARALNDALENPKREIAVRFPDSPAEVQLSSELERPITTTAITYRHGRPVKSFDDALGIVRQGVSNSGINREISAIRHRLSKFSGALSTVVEAERLSGIRGNRYHIFRDGEISERQIRASLATLDRYIVRYTEWD
jgi:L-threonylcarbamoyladenylate synthase